jgi:hypothetical protein
VNRAPWALTLPGAIDPIEGLIDAARLELAALADAAPSKVIADAINFVGRRLDVAMILLARCDNRAPRLGSTVPRWTRFPRLASRHP